MSEHQMKDRITEEPKKAKEAGQNTAILKEKARHAAEAAAERLKEAGKDTAKATSEVAGKAAGLMAKEAKELEKRSVDVAKRAISGMWKGARGAFKKGGEGK